MQNKLDDIVDRIASVILGKERQIRLALCCLIARGHLLIEDVPGVGKTTLSHVLAQVLGLSYQRIQFTSDLLPADILGVSIYDRDTAEFTFHPGPIFSQLILADEINRATPKAQSALLEAMEEHQVTQEGETRELPEPFFVIATQNPSHQVGTFPLPESQLDRFMMCLELGYPDPDAERELFAGEDRRDMIQQLEAQVAPGELAGLQAQVSSATVSGALLDYLQAIIHFTRHSPDFISGLSPRAGLAILNSARAWALMSGRSHVIPEDLQAVIPGVVNHRLSWSSKRSGQDNNNLAQMLLEQVPIP